MGGEHTKPILFTDGLLLVLHQVLEIFVFQRFPELIEHVHEAATVNHLLGAINQIHHHRPTNLRLLQELGYIEAVDFVGGQIERIGRVVKHPAVFATLAPLQKPRMHGSRAVIVTHMHGMGQTLQKDAHAAQGLVDRLRHEGVNTLVDLFLILAGHRPGSRYQGANKALEERQVSRRRLKLERVEPGALAHLEGQVATAQRADKHLKATVFVECSDARPELLSLSERETQGNGLTRTRLAGKHGVTQHLFVEAVLLRIRVVIVEIQRRTADGLQDCDRWPPWVASRLAAQEVVQWRQRQEVQGGDRSRPWPVFEVARQLRPIPGLKCKINLCINDASVTQR